MNVLQKEKLEAFRRWQVLTSSNQADLEGSLEKIGIYRLDSLQKCLLSSTLELNRIVHYLDHQDISLLPIHKIEIQLISFRKMVIQFFEEEDIINAKLGLEFDRQHEREHADIIQLTYRVREEFKNGKIKIALGLHNKVVAKLIKHFNNSNLTHFNLESMGEFLKNASSWQEFALVFSFPTLNIDNFHFETLLVKLMEKVQNIRAGRETSLLEFWNEFGPTLIKQNNLSKIATPGWKLNNDYIVHTLQNLFRQIDETLFKLNPEQFNETVLKMYSNCLKVFKFWELDFFSQSNFFHIKVENAIAFNDLASTFPINQDESFAPIFKDSLQRILSFKYSNKSLDRDECINFLKNLNSLYVPLKTRENPFLKVKKDKIIFCLKNIESTVKLAGGIPQTQQLDLLSTIIIECWHFFSRNKEETNE